jgi:hypothetical protein
LPRIVEILDSLSGKKFFTVLDMKSGYHQIIIEENHKERTALMVWPLGFYEFTNISFDLANAPAMYQRLQEQCLGDLHVKICVIYLDDLIISSRTYEEHLNRQKQVFTEYGPMDSNSYRIIARFYEGDVHGSYSVRRSPS